jgi:hypothetical protein
MVWQPVAGWQTNTPVGPHGAHERLQQLPPHEGMPPSATPPTVPPQRTPSGIWQFAGPVGGGPHVPSVAPAGTLQLPPQQSVPVWHVSPCWLQKDPCWQVPPLQRPEQQSVLEVHALPSVLHIGLSAAHRPLVQLPLQHWLPVVHAVPSGLQLGKAQAPPVQTPLQHTELEAHALPSCVHPPSPNGLPPSPRFTMPLLLPLAPPLLLVLAPLLLVLAPLLLVLAPLLLPLLLLDVASPPSPLPAPLLVLPPQAMNELPVLSPTRSPTHTTSAVRRRIIIPTVAGSIPAGTAHECRDLDVAPRLNRRDQ